MENSKLLLGIGIGAIVGSLVTCFAKSAKGQKMRKDLSSSFHELEGDAEDIRNRWLQTAGRHAC